MNYRYMIDSYAWICYFSAAEPGRKLLKEVKAGRETPGRSETARVHRNIGNHRFAWEIAVLAGQIDTRESAE